MKLARNIATMLTLTLSLNSFAMTGAWSFEMRDDGSVFYIVFGENGDGKYCDLGGSEYTGQLSTAPIKYKISERYLDVTLVGVDIARDSRNQVIKILDENIRTDGRSVQVTVNGDLATMVPENSDVCEQ